MTVARPTPFAVLALVASLAVVACGGAAATPSDGAGDAITVSGSSTVEPISTCSFFSWPDTCVPTSTNSLGWSVPVAVLIWLAVRYHRKHQKQESGTLMMATHLSFYNTNMKTIL